MGVNEEERKAPRIRSRVGSPVATYNLRAINQHDVQLSTIITTSSWNVYYCTHTNHWFFFSRNPVST